MRDPKLTTEQKEKLAILEPMLREAASSHDFERAKEVTFRIQNVLRPTGNETRLMESKNRLMELWQQVTITGYKVQDIYVVHCHCNVSSNRVFSNPKDAF